MKGNRVRPPVVIAAAQDAEPPRAPVIAFFHGLGPGLITGAADDDPSGISTYSVAGATFGLAPLWTALFSFPLMVAVQLMCARLGMVTGRGLAANIGRHFPKWVMWTACGILLVANIFNIGADLSGMGDSMELVTRVPSIYWSPFFGILLVALVILASYKLVARVFKWLTLVLFAYVVTAFLVHPQWRQVLHATLVPDVHLNRDFFMILTGILGTTISPYLFFWQSSQEVEEEYLRGRSTLRARRGATDEELRDSRNDVMTGMFFSNAVMFFIILTTATTLHARGLTRIETARQAGGSAQAAGRERRLFAVHAGNCRHGYAGCAGAGGVLRVCGGGTRRRWGASLNSSWRVAPKFYGVLATAVALGMLFQFAGLPSVRMLFWSAVLNGVLAPPLMCWCCC